MPITQTDTSDVHGPGWEPQFAPDLGAGLCLYWLWAAIQTWFLCIFTGFRKLELVATAAIYGDGLPARLSCVVPRASALVALCSRKWQLWFVVDFGSAVAGVQAEENPHTSESVCCDPIAENSSHHALRRMFLLRLFLVAYTQNLHDACFIWSSTIANHSVDVQRLCLDI